MNLDQLATIIGAVVGPLAGAVAAYYAIRQDLAVLRVRIDAHDQTLVQALRRADDAHGRIDDVLSKR
jgi:outer membrane lipoprotein SlyB